MGKYRGAAPGCGIISLKVLDRYGNGSQEDLLRAIRWIREYRKQYRIRVVNISVGTTCNSKKEDSRLLESVEELWDEGMVIVTAAGNQGPKPGSITAPGNSRKVITVGSSDLLEGQSAISGRGRQRSVSASRILWLLETRLYPAYRENRIPMEEKAAPPCLRHWFPVLLPVCWKKIHPLQTVTSSQCC